MANTDSALWVRVTRSVSSDLPMFIENPITISPGEYPATINPQGAVSAVLANGGKLGLRPHEFEFIAENIATLLAPLPDVRVWPENFWREVWHEGCPKRGMMRHGMPGKFRLADGSILREYECLGCGARCFAGLNAQRGIVTHPFSIEALVRGCEP